jgi:glutamyl/glutaminyl-tRNA synthetase
MERYRAVAEDLVKAGKAYYAYETKAELEAMREAAMAAGTEAALQRATARRTKRSATIRTA